MNQDNFFAIQDGDIKIFGVFDGHGLNGHCSSSFAMGSMVDFLKNRKNKLDWTKASNEEVEKLMRKCFRYAQDKLKEQFKDYLLQSKQKNEKLKNQDQLEKRGVNDIEMIEEEDLDLVGMDSDEREFVENISWDTESDQNDVERDDKLINQHFSDNVDIQYSQDDINSEIDVNYNKEEDQERKFGEFYNYNFHAFKKKYRD